MRLAPQTVFASVQYGGVVGKHHTRLWGLHLGVRDRRSTPVSLFLSRCHISPKSTSLLRSAPYFPVANLEESAAHYEQVLGFRREYVGGSPPEFAIVSRDGLPIMLRLVPTPAKIVPNERQGGTWDAFFWVRDAQALHAELRASGADIVYGPIVQEEYQMEEFAVRDREGYVLGFGQAL
jgi:catechol 2,3-dioxygenase-like lactoylglutathione lyase family enzyme